MLPWKRKDRIRKSFIWNRSQLWNHYNDIIFTKMNLHSGCELWLSLPCCKGGQPCIYVELNLKDNSGLDWMSSYRNFLWSCIGIVGFLNIVLAIFRRVYSMKISRRAHSILAWDVRSRIGSTHLLLLNPDNFFRKGFFTNLVWIWAGFFPPIIWRLSKTAAHLPKKTNGSSITYDIT